MRDQWYGDNRDLVKWGVLVELAERYGARHILQVLYYRPTGWGSLEIDGRPVELPEVVRRHFRDATAICALQCHAKVEVIKEPFIDRREYLQIVLDRIRLRKQLPGLVFLDPDTGLEPAAGSAAPEHVLESELTAIWREIAVDDVLVFYQHQTNRNATPWIEPKRRQFERALGVQDGSTNLAAAPRIASDVAFFFARKDAPTVEVPVQQPSTGEEESRVDHPSADAQSILDCLNRMKTRATYSAVAAVLGVPARSVARYLGVRRPEASWVVNRETGLPSGYATDQMHPDLTNSPLIRTGDELQKLLKRCEAG